MSPHQLLGRCSLLVGILLLGGGNPASAQETSYLLLFASQRSLINPNHSHSFATFVRVRGNGPQPGIPVIESHTISWLPANGHVRVLAVFPEPGRNFDLHTTLRLVLGDGQRVWMWGPYQIDPALYYRACRQQQLLESGQVRFKALDNFRMSDRVCNCIHAIGSVVDGDRIRLLNLSCGVSATLSLLRHATPWIVEPGRVHPSVASALWLDDYTLVRQPF